MTTDIPALLKEAQRYNPDTGVLGEPDSWTYHLCDLITRLATALRETLRCDCENPEPADGVALVSEECPVHGGDEARWS